MSEQKTYRKGDVVTVSLEDATSSNVYIVDEDQGDNVLLTHPLAPYCLVRTPKAELDKVAPNLKDSTERSLDFARNKAKYLDYNTVADLEALCLYFTAKRKLTPRQKSTLSSINGLIASILLNNDIKLAMRKIQENSALLDDFNAMWYRNFQKLFTGQQQIVSKKQRAAIFNIAGFILAELERQIAFNQV